MLHKPDVHLYGVFFFQSSEVCKLLQHLVILSGYPCCSLCLPVFFSLLLVRLQHQLQLPNAQNSDPDGLARGKSQPQESGGGPRVRKGFAVAVAVGFLKRFWGSRACFCWVILVIWQDMKGLGQVDSICIKKKKITPFPGKTLRLRRKNRKIEKEASFRKKLSFMKFRKFEEQNAKGGGKTPTFRMALIKWNV